MSDTSRSYLTAGVAALGASVIALTPVQPIPGQIAVAPERVVSNLSMDLAAAIDPITPWVTALNSAVDNAYALQDTWNANPFPIISQIAQNQFVYLSEFPNIGLIAQQIFGNVGKFLKAPFETGAANVNDKPVPGASPAFLNQRFLYNTLTTLDPALEPVLSLLTSPASGFLLGFAGPGLSSMLQIQETIKNILAPPPGAKPVLNAINEIINLPANLFNAAFNGGKFLDLTNLVKNLVGPIVAPAITSAGIRTGGFLNAGGVAFDSLSASATLGLSIVDPGLSVGFIGATGTLANHVADAIKVVPPPTTASSAPGTAAAAAPAAAEVAVPVEVATAEVAVPVEVATAADAAPAPKRPSRAAKADNGKGNTGRAERSARRGD